jgi:glutamyl-tRNA reductase
MPVSIPSVAVELAGRIFSPLSDRKVLLLGAGEMGELTAKYLAEAGVQELFIANRTPEKARTLAGKLGGRALSMTEGHKELRKMDIVLTSVSGGDFLLTGPALADVMRERNGKPLFIIDMGVPRNVDPEAGKVEAIYLYNIDDLSQAAETNREARRSLVESAEAILKEDIEKLCSWLNTLELVPTIVRLREKFEGLRKTELEEFLKKNPGLSEKEVKAVERLTHDLTAKLLHDPSVTLKNVRTAADRFEFARMLNEIFALMGKNEE